MLHLRMTTSHPKQIELQRHFSGLSLVTVYDIKMQVSVINLENRLDISVPPKMTVDLIFPLSILFCYLLDIICYEWI